MLQFKGNRVWKEHYPNEPYGKQTKEVRVDFLNLNYYSSCMFCA
jgi:hypothetical protein